MANGLEGLNIGELGIEVSLDTSSVEAGVNRVSQGLDEARTAAQSAFADMNRLGQTVQGIVGPLTKMGTVISSSFLGLASMAPQVAPFLEKMKTDFFRLSNIAGEELAPAFRDVSNLFSDFVDFMGGEGRGVLEAINSVVTGTVDGFRNLGEAIDNIQETVNISIGVDLQGFLKELSNAAGPEAVMSMLGFAIGGPPGAAIAGGATTAARGIGNAGQGEFTNAFRAVGGGALTGAGIGAAGGAAFGGVGAVPGLIAGAGVGGLAGGAAFAWQVVNQAPSERARAERMRHANRK